MDTETTTPSTPTTVTATVMVRGVITPYAIYAQARADDGAWTVTISDAHPAMQAFPAAPGGFSGRYRHGAFEYEPGSMRWSHSGRQMALWSLERAIVAAIETGQDVDVTLVERVTTTLRRADHDPGEAWPEWVREDKMAVRAGERHLSRVAFAEWVLACRVDGADLDEGMVTLDAAGVRRARVLAALEEHGVGGPRGYVGGATERMPWARALGKGRKQAVDGEAWSAALRSAFGPDHAPPTPAEVVAEVEGDRSIDRWGLAYACYQAFNAITPAEAHRWDAARQLIKAGAPPSDPEARADFTTLYGSLYERMAEVAS